MLLVALYSIPLKEGHVTLLIYDQHGLPVFLYEFSAEFLSGADRAGIVDIARPMHLL
jgi:hypothetical protein